ncbi:hypothetical protein D5085_09455 [Ectothiorhodospiraceae bacterium BW-2]|nr:hypothetical protein D5085_09455 [Ectothiorhodospiraceae bacterium BW-2]
MLVANITPEAAKIRAREDAYADIIAQGAGVKVNKEVLIVNGQLVSFQRTRHLNARVVNGQCDYQNGQNSSGQLTISARCQGEVMRYGSLGPAMTAQLNRLPANAKQCRQQQVNQPTPLFKLRSDEKFCLQITTAETIYISVYAQYNNEQGELRFNRLWPTASSQQSVIEITPKQMWLSPVIASAPLPGQSESLESLLILASSRKELLTTTGGNIGNSALSSASQSLSAQQFDQLLQQTDSHRLTLRQLPFWVESAIMK